jgi:adenylate cyclase
LIDEAEGAASSAGLDLSRLYDLFRGRVAAFQTDPPPPDWDGVFVATTKG